MTAFGYEEDDEIVPKLLHPQLYAVQNKKSGGFFETRAGKMVWQSIGAAKNGFNNAQPWTGKTFTFDGQDQWEVVEVRLCPVESE